jgi:hypothetical protein
MVDLNCPGNPVYYKATEGQFVSDSKVNDCTKTFYLGDTLHCCFCLYQKRSL